VTLLLNLINPQGIHRSSDYRLTDLSTRRTVEDEFGSKQIHHATGNWSAWISFTGIASIGTRKTRNWILEVLGQSAGMTDPTLAMAQLAQRATTELRSVPPKDRILTIVATIRETGLRARVFVISCIERPGMPPLKQPLDHFEAYQVSTDTSRELIFGYTKAVSQADRKFLKRLNRRKAEPEEIRRVLAGINSRSARRSRGLISEGCFVSSTMPDGTGASENFGRTPGIPLDVAGSAEMLRLIEGAQKTNRPVFVQGREVSAKNVRELTSPTMNVSQGSTLVVKTSGGSGIRFVTDSSGNTFKSAPNPSGVQVVEEESEWAKFEEGSAGSSRRVAYASPSAFYTFNGPNGLTQGNVEISGVSGEAVIAKNRITKITLGTVQVRGFAVLEQPAEALKTLWEIESQPTIDGAQPHGWGYTVDLMLDASGASLSIRRNSVALRPTDATMMSCVEPSEELIVVSSLRPPVLKISRDRLDTSGVIEARLLLRDIRPPAAESLQLGGIPAASKIGRNSVCPCGSGAKYKKCCLNKLESRKP
jgi:hypothetical protein